MLLFFAENTYFPVLTKEKKLPTINPSFFIFTLWLLKNRMNIF